MDGIQLFLKLPDTEGASVYVTPWSICYHNDKWLIKHDAGTHAEKGGTATLRVTKRESVLYFSTQDLKKYIQESYPIDYRGWIATAQTKLVEDWPEMVFEKNFLPIQPQ